MGTMKKTLEPHWLSDKIYFTLSLMSCEDLLGSILCITVLDEASSILIGSITMNLYETTKNLCDEDGNPQKQVVKVSENLVRDGQVFGVMSCTVSRLVRPR